MPDLRSVTPTWDVPAEAARAVDLLDRCYEELLELESLLGGYDELPEPPRWVFGVLRVIGRARDLADTGRTAALRVRSFHDDAKPAIEAGDAG